MGAGQGAGDSQVPLMVLDQVPAILRDPRTKSGAEVWHVHVLRSNPVGGDRGRDSE